MRECAINSAEDRVQSALKKEKFPDQLSKARTDPVSADEDIPARVSKIMFVYY